MAEPTPVDIVQISDKEIFQDMLNQMSMMHDELVALNKEVTSLGGSGGESGGAPGSGVSSGASQATFANPTGAHGGDAPYDINQHVNPLRDPYAYMQSVIQGAAGPGWEPPYIRSQKAAQNPNYQYEGPGLLTSGLQSAGQYAAPLIGYNLMPNIGGAIQQTAGQFLNPWAASQTGANLGTMPAQGAINVGPMRLPLGQWETGISTAAQSLWQGITSPGLSMQDVTAIKSGLGNVGWTAGSPGFNNLTAGLSDLQQFGGTRMPVDEQTIMMGDQATRLGAASVDDFVSTMKEVPSAAKTAQVSIAQMKSDMDALGQANQARGGTYFQGARMGPLWSGITGMPASTLPDLLNNPFVQAQASRMSGLMPGMQGILGPGQQMQSVYSALNTMSGISQFKPIKRTLPGGFQDNISARDQQIGFLHTMFPEIGNEQIRNMTNPHYAKGIQAEFQLVEQSDAWGKNVMRNPSLANMNAGAGKGNLGDLLHYARMSRDPVTGKRLFTHENIDQIMNDPGSLTPKKPGQSPSDYVNTLAEHIKERTGRGGAWAQQQAEAKARASDMQQILTKAGRNQQKQRGGQNQTKIGLTNEARRFFQLQGHRGQAKSAAGAGQGSTNEGYQLPTDWASSTHDVGKAATDAWGAAGSAYDSMFGG